MKINYNISAMVANSALQTNDNMLTASLEKLSSGLKINHAKDNASGLAMAKRMNAQIRSLEVADQNANDGISVIEIAEGALAEVSDMVQRMNELAVKASTGSLNDEDRKMIDDEIKQLRAEIERVADTTMYNGEVLLDGSFDLKGYTDNANVKVITYSDEVLAGDYELNLSASLDADGNVDPSTLSVTFGAGFDDPSDFSYEASRDSVFITGPNNFSMELMITGDVSTDVTINATGL